MTLTDSTDDQLNVAFAERVAGYTDIRFEEGENVDIESRSIYPWEGWRGTLNGERQHIPHFISSMDAVLPWLEKQSLWFIEQTPRGTKVAFTMNDSRWVAVNSSTPRACVIALLRAHGVQVEFTT